MKRPITLEISDDGKRIEVWFKYNDEYTQLMKTEISAPRFVPKDRSYNGAAHWTVPLDIEACREIRRVFGDGDHIVIEPKLDRWARDLIKYERNLRTIATSDTARLKVLPHVLPKLYEAIHLGPLGRWMTPEEREKALRSPASFQAADVAWMAHADNPLNGNHPGLGKTLETIAAIYEGRRDDGPKLVIAPKSAMEATWLDELLEWQEEPVYVSTGAKKRKEAIIAAFDEEIVREGFSGWLVVNPDQVRFRESFEPCEYHCGRGMDAKTKAEMRKCMVCVVSDVSEFPTLHRTKWSVIVLDECHKGAIRNSKTPTARGMLALRTKEGDQGRIALTGTPMGGKIINLWGLLHYLNPKVFTSKWRWAEMWTDVTKKDIFVKGGHGQTKTARSIGDSIRHCERHFGWSDEEEGHRPIDCVGCAEIEDAFYLMLAPYMTRRTKAEALPWLPPKQFVPIWCDFESETHRKQYNEFAESLQTMIDDEIVTSVNVLDEYMRLKQFAFSRHDRRPNGKLIPTTDSGKLGAIRGKLEELGIWDGSSKEQAIIFSQFSEVVDLIHGWLNESGVPATKITGDVNKTDVRRQIKNDFQGGKGARVIVITTTAGGVSITLDAASSVFIVDETWNPDDQEQAEDRAHRASRIHQVTVYYLRMLGTIEEMIAEINDTKKSRNTRVLDARRLLERSSRARMRTTNARRSLRAVSRVG